MPEIGDTVGAVRNEAPERISAEKSGRFFLTPGMLFGMMHSKNREREVMIMNIAFWNNLFNFCNIVMWTLLLLNFIQVIGGLLYNRKIRKKGPAQLPKECPMVSVIVPAHNEALVIRKTVEALLRFDYPQDRYEIIVMNDNSSDNSAEILAQIRKEYPGRNLKVIHTDSSNGGKGKANVLNLAMEHISGSLISIYDADNTPEPDALRLLVAALMEDDSLGAVAGMFRTRNRNANLLTRCINVETLSTQCSHQAGRYQFFKLSLLPGTNYVIRRSVIEEIGGWEPGSLTEDTELSYRMHRSGHRIRYIPSAVSWEQEPQSLKIWFKQRARWIRGNFQVFRKYFHCLFDPSVGQMRIEIFQYLLTMFFMTVIGGISHMISLLIWFGVLPLTTPLATLSNWILMSVIFVATMFFGTFQVKKEAGFQNLLVSVCMLLYSVLWYLLIFYSVFQGIRRRITGEADKWDKTVRFEENPQDSREETPV